MSLPVRTSGNRGYGCNVGIDRAEALAIKAKAKGIVTQRLPGTGAAHDFKSFVCGQGRILTESDERY